VDLLRLLGELLQFRREVLRDLNLLLNLSENGQEIAFDEPAVDAHGFLGRFVGYPVTMRLFFLS